MSETDELQQALDDLAGVQLVDNTWQEAEAVRREITGIIQALHRDLCAEASAACQEWDAEATELRERLAEVERVAETRLARIEVLRGALEIVGVETQALKPEVQQVRVGVLDLMRERDDLRQQLATVTDLVPEAELLNLVETALTEWAAYLENCEDDEHEIRVYRAYANDVRALAARIRAWRGDGDGGEKRGGESDGNA